MEQKSEYLLDSLLILQEDMSKKSLLVALAQIPMRLMIATGHAEAPETVAETQWSEMMVYMIATPSLYSREEKMPS